jgi:hypothetical protein
MANAHDDACEYAKQHYRNCAMWLNLWKVLLFAFGTTVVIFCILAIVLYINASSLPGALSVLGTIVNGLGIGWVVTQKNKASDDERAAFDALTKECAPPGKQLIGVRQQPWFQQLQSSAWRSLFSRTTGI